MNRNFKIIVVCAFLFVVSITSIITVLVTKSEVKNNKVADNQIRECKFFCVSDFETGVLTHFLIELTQNF